MQLDIFTLFPGWFDWFLGQRHISGALAAGSAINLFDYRETTPLPQGQVDDTPYGGGAGMVLRVDVVDAALRAAYGDDLDQALSARRVLLLSPTGRLLDDKLIDELARERSLTLLCGRYEGVDERVAQHLCHGSISIGRYVLSGGELAAMVVADAIYRKLPGALGDEQSAVEESFSRALGGAPEYPHYTRPASFRGWEVPQVLTSGDHERIREWRHEQSRRRMEEGVSS